MVQDGYGENFAPLPCSLNFNCTSATGLNVFKNRIDINFKRDL